MAVTIASEKAKVKIQLVEGIDEMTGREKLVSRTYNNVNPQVANEDLYHVAQEMATLQTKPLKTVIKTEEKELVE